MSFLGIALALLLLPIPAAVQGVGSVTLLEGSLHVVRGTSVLVGAEGMRLRASDILETSEKGFVQLEFADGAVVALGPSSRLFVLRHAAGVSGGKGGSEAADLVLLSGWLKGESNSKAGLYKYESPLLAAAAGNGTVVVHSYEGECDVYVEAGSATVSEVSPDGGSRSPTNAKGGQFLSRRAGKGVTSASRPTAAFIEAMPGPFRDTLPSRLAHFAGKTVEPKTDHAVSYLEIQAWLTMPAGWRRGFVERFGPRLKDPVFRKQLEAHIGPYPEWDAILHPEKHPPEKERSEIAPAAASNPENPHPRL